MYKTWACVICRSSIWKLVLNILREEFIKNTFLDIRIHFWIFTFTAFVRYIFSEQYLYFLRSKGSYLVCCIVDTKNILKYRNLTSVNSLLKSCILKSINSIYSLIKNCLLILSFPSPAFIGGMKREIIVKFWQNNLQNFYSQKVLPFR